MVLRFRQAEPTTLPQGRDLMRIQFSVGTVQFSYHGQSLTMPRAEYAQNPGEALCYAVFFFLHW